MATPPNNPNPGGPFPPGDPRNGSYGAPFSQDPRVRQEQERAWAQAQRDQANAQRDQSKAWDRYYRDASKQQAQAIRQQARMAAQAQKAQIRAMRRSNRAQSIIGPLLLIAVAIVAILVYNGHIPALAFVNWFARWWPLVLIAAGLLRLAEWGVSSYTSQQRGVPVRFAIGGGTIFLLILISLTGLAAQGGVHRIGNDWNFGWNGNDLNQFFGSKHEEDAAATTHSIADDGTLEIHNDHGDVTVVGTSDDGLIHLSEHKEVYANTDDRASSLMSDLNPQFTGTDSNLVLRIASSDRSSASLSLTVPRGVHIVLNSNHGDVSVHGFQAPVAVNANRGDVDVSGIAAAVQVRTNSRHGSVQVHSVRGAVQLAGSGDEVNLNDIYGPITVNGDFFGSGHLQHVSGPVTYSAGRISFSAASVAGEVSFDSDDEFTASGATGPLNVKTRSRNITLDRVSGNMQVTNSSGNVDITAVTPVGAITVENRDGDVSLSLPGSAHFTLAADTSDGSVQSSFPGAATGQTNSSHRGSFATTVGSGGPAIRLTTTHGNIALEPTDHVQMPHMPAVPVLTATPSNLSQSLKEMQKDAAESQKEAERSRMEGLKEAERARAEGLKEAQEARAEAAKARDEALREAAQQRKEAEQERQQQLREAESERKQALAEAARERQEALREAQRARQEAQRERQRSAPNPPNPPSSPQ